MVPGACDLVPPGAASARRHGEDLTDLLAALEDGRPGDVHRGRPHGVALVDPASEVPRAAHEQAAGREHREHRQSPCGAEPAACDRDGDLRDEQHGQHADRREPQMLGAQRATGGERREHQQPVTRWRTATERERLRVEEADEEGGGGEEQRDERHVDVGRVRLLEHDRGQQEERAGRRRATLGDADPARQRADCERREQRRPDLTDVHERVTVREHGRPGLQHLAVRRIERAAVAVRVGIDAPGLHPVRDRGQVIRESVVGEGRQDRGEDDAPEQREGGERDDDRLPPLELQPPRAARAAPPALPAAVEQREHERRGEDGDEHAAARVLVGHRPGRERAQDDADDRQARNGEGTLEAGLGAGEPRPEPCRQDDEHRRDDEQRPADHDARRSRPAARRARSYNDGTARRGASLLALAHRRAAPASAPVAAYPRAAATSVAARASRSSADPAAPGCRSKYLSTTRRRAASPAATLAERDTDELQRR